MHSLFFVAILISSQFIVAPLVFLGKLLFPRPLLPGVSKVKILFPGFFRFEGNFIQYKTWQFIVTAMLHGLSNTMLSI